MRSHPFQPQAPIVSEIADYIPIPNRSAERRGSDAAELDDLDPDTNRLLPTSTNETISPRLGHHVMVQGRLAVVRSVSVAGLRVPSVSPHPHPGPSTGGSTSTSTRNSVAAAIAAGPASAGLVSPRGFEDAVGGTVRRQPQRRRATGDYMAEDGDLVEEGERRGRERDRQFRGYGIGGAGNIRRPTDVTYSSSRRRTASSSPDRRRWKVREFLGLGLGDRKGKSREAPS